MLATNFFLTVGIALLTGILVFGATGWFRGYTLRRNLARPPSEFSQENPPDWVIAFQAQNTWGGGGCTLRVLLFEGSRSGTACVYFTSDLEGTRREKADSTTPLKENEVEKLLGVVAHTFPGGFAGVENAGDDGTPCEVENPSAHTVLVRKRLL